MAYVGNQHWNVDAEVSQSVIGEDRVRVLLGETRVVFKADEAESLALRLMREAKVARGSNPAIQHANADIYDAAGWRMCEIKIGDRVRIVQSAYNGAGRQVGDTGVVVSSYPGGCRGVRMDSGTPDDSLGDGWGFFPSELELIERDA